MKKYINKLFVLLTSFSLIFLTSLSNKVVYAADSNYEYRDFDGGVEITKYIGTNNFVSIPSKINGKDVVKIGDTAFENKNINTISIPASVKSIGHYAFYNNNLTSVDLPESVTWTGYYAFSANDITSVTLPSGLSTISVGLFRDNKLISIDIPEGVVNIEAQAFYINNLQILVLPNSVEIIEEDAFSMNNLWEVILSKNLRHIEAGAFQYNPINDLRIYPKVQSIHADAFPNSTNNIEGLPGSLAESYATFKNSNFSPLTVINQLTLQDIPNKTEYLQNDIFNSDGLKIKAIYHDIDNFEEMADHEYLTFSDYNFTGDNFGKQTVQAKYFDKTVSFDVYYNRFKDVSSKNSFYEYITELSNDDIIKGYSDSTFKPNNSLTRAQAAKMIVLSAGIDTTGASSNFKDVKSSSSSYEYISAAYEAGIIKGYADGRFKSNDLVTRAQIAKMVSIAFNLSKDGNPPPFVDVEKLGSANTREYIYTLSSLDIVKGYGNEFRPYNNVTRGQFSKIVSIARTK